jgi:FKBP-type peptidyl-prolyl cis-trans isomerase FkpA
MLAAAALLFTSCNQEGKRIKSPNGYEYTIHTKAGGKAPQPGDYVYFHAQIRHADSVVYRTRVQSPEAPFFEIPAEETEGRKPSPIEDVLRLMTLGDSATVFISLDTVQQKPAGFEDVNEIIYDIVMVDLKSAGEFQTHQDQLRQEAETRASEVRDMVAKIVKDYGEGTLNSQIKATPSGLKYLLYEQGIGPKADPGSQVLVHYFGVLTDGQEFDNSFSRGQALPFMVGQGQVIPGWDEGIGLLNKGGKAALFIPSELGYGKAGAPPAIPADAELIFYVEVVDVQKVQ